MYLVPVAVAALSALASSQAPVGRELTAYVGQPVVTAQSPVSNSGSVTSSAPRCLLAPGLQAASSRECQACHDAHGGPSHPFDVDHDVARMRRVRSRSPLRPATEVVRRGVFLPDGKITCLTCHDGASTWKDKLALPADSRLRRQDSPGRMLASGRAVASSGRSFSSGPDVEYSELCNACHMMQ